MYYASLLKHDSKFTHFSISLTSRKGKCLLDVVKISVLFIILNG